MKPATLVARRSFLRTALGVLVAPFVALPRRAAFATNAALTVLIADPSIIVTKSKRRLQLFSQGNLVRTYRVGLGLSPVEDKIRAGDRRTPEGEFYICMKNSHSQFYLSLGLSYPNQKHAERGLRDGLITRGQYNQIVNALARKRVPNYNGRVQAPI
jgi:L,D-transpeptidase catalytic domain